MKKVQWSTLTLTCCEGQTFDRCDNCRVHHSITRSTSMKTTNIVKQNLANVEKEYSCNFVWVSPLRVFVFRFLDFFLFFQEGEGVHIHFFKPKQGKAILMTYRTIKSAPLFSEKCCGLIDGSKLEKVNYRSFWRGVR